VCGKGAAHKTTNDAALENLKKALENPPQTAQEWPPRNGRLYW
jgi:hypothetical protein